MRRPLLFTLLVLSGIALDLLTKWLAFSRLGKDDVYPLIPGVIHIVTAENTGVAFSLLKGQSALIVAISLAAVAAFSVIYAKVWRNASPLLLVAIGLLLVGAIGNLVDRLCFGHVRDFIDFVPELPLIGHWAVFNVADACITVGVGALLVYELLVRPKVVAAGAGAESRDTSRKPSDA